MPSNHLILCYLLLLLPSVFPSIRVFSDESALHIKDQRIGVSASTSVLSMNTQDWSPLGWTSWQIDGETIETVTVFIFLGSKLTADCNFIHSIKRHLLLGRKAMKTLVQFSRSVVSDSVTPWTPLSIANSRSLLKLMSIELMMPSNYLILCRPLLLLPSIFPSIRVFSNESVLCIRWPKYWEFQLQHQSFQ